MIRFTDEQIASMSDGYPPPEHDFEEAIASLSAEVAELRKPRKNCDRFASYKDAWKEFQKLHENDVPVVAEMLEWLFAPVVEGGES